MTSCHRTFFQENVRCLLNDASDVSKCTQQFAPVLKFSSCKFLYPTFLLLVLLSVIVSVLLQIVYSFSALFFSSSYGTFNYYISPPSVFVLSFLFSPFLFPLLPFIVPYNPGNSLHLATFPGSCVCVCVCVCVLCTHVLRVAFPCCQGKFATTPCY